MAVDLYEKAKGRLARERGGLGIDVAAPVRFALAFPNEYRVGMASLGYQLVYRMLNELPSASCERVFLPDAIDIDEHARTHTEIFTLESLRPLSEFHALAFSISFEIDYINVVRMLDLTNLSVLSVDRDDYDPIIIAGGPCATFNPEPLADIIDAFVIGDAEEVLPALVDAMEASLRKPRADRLAALASVPSVYVPSVPQARPVRRAIARDLASYPADSIIHTAEAEFGDISLVEVARGCGRKCRFCVAGHITRPPRPRGSQINGVSDGIRLGLVGAAVFDHPEAVDICRSIVDSGGEFTVSSVRLETVTPEIARLMIAGGQRTLTIAPEAGSDRLRRVINKSCAEDEILQAVSAASEAGFARVKLYFMIGLPTETDDDITAIADLAGRLSREFPAMQFQISVSSFVPKPWTPFQWRPMERESVLKKRYARLRAGISSIKNARFSGESPRLAVVQGYLARGDRRLGAMLIEAARNGGDYSAALRANDVDPAQYIYRERPENELLPWDHLDILIDKDCLLAEYRKALREETSAPCSVQVCTLCGACE